MTADDIAKAREIIAAGKFADYKRYEEGIIPTLDFLQAARTGWPEALDEVERLQREINHFAYVADKAAIDRDKYRAEADKLRGVGEKNDHG